MELIGRVWKDGRDPGWLAEISSIDVMTQGKNKKDALFMIGDAVSLLMEDLFEDKKFKIEVIYYGSDLFGISCSDSTILLAFTLRRKRELNNN